MSVVLNGSYSIIESGIPQGSGLGPLVIFPSINDLERSAEVLKFYLSVMNLATNISTSVQQE